MRPTPEHTFLRTPGRRECQRYWFFVHPQLKNPILEYCSPLCTCTTAGSTGATGSSSTCSCPSTGPSSGCARQATPSRRAAAALACARRRTSSPSSPTTARLPPAALACARRRSRSPHCPKAAPLAPAAPTALAAAGVLPQGSAGRAPPAWARARRPSRWRSDPSPGRPGRRTWGRRRLRPSLTCCWWVGARIRGAGRPVLLAFPSGRAATRAWRTQACSPGHIPSPLHPAPMCAQVYAFLPPTRAMVGAIVREKELRLREGLRIFGLSVSACVHACCRPCGRVMLVCLGAVLHCASACQPPA
jgi:hypothetical protein